MFELYRLGGEHEAVPAGFRGRMVVPLRNGEEALSPRPGQYLAAVGHREKFLEALGPEDVVSLPLYKGGVLEPGPYPPQPLEDYAEHLSLLREVAPRVRGIITGQHGPELSYKHLGWGPAQNIPRMVRFVHMTAPQIVAAGAQPFYGPIDWDLMHDVYGGVKPSLYEEVAKHSGVMVCFTGFTLVPGCHMQENVVHFMGEQEARIQREDPGAERLREYLQAAECWSGVGGRAGLEAGNAERLAEFGFRGGIVAL